MKLLIAFLLLIPILSNGQIINSTSGKGLRNIYNNALFHFITIIKHQDKKYLDTLFIETDILDNSDDILNEIQGVRTKTLGWTERDELHEPERPFLFIRLHPINYKNGKFYIIISIADIEKKNNKKYSFENGVVLFYSFDSTKKKFKYSSFEILETITTEGKPDY